MGAIGGSRALKQGVLEPLDPYVAKSKLKTSAFYPRLLNGFKGPDGKTYGFPKDWSPLGMETNNRLLSEAGVKPPRTWAQLTAAARKIKISGGRAICLSPSWDRLLAFVYQNNGTFLNASKTQSTVNSPAVRQAANFYVGLIRSGLAGTPAQLGVGWCGEALGKEKAAIIFEGNWVIPYMTDTFPNVPYTTSMMTRGKQEGQPRLHGLLLDGPRLEEQGSGVAAAPLPRRAAGHEDVDVEGARAALARRRQAGSQAARR